MITVIKYVFKNLPLWLFICAIFAACSAQKRLNRILNNNPELKQDKTVVLFDTVKIQGSKVDTLVNITYSKDTIVIRRDSVLTKVYFYKDKTGQKAYISQEQKPRQIIKKFTVTVPQIIYKYDDKKRWEFFWIGAAVCLFIIIVIIVVMFLYGPKRF